MNDRFRFRAWNKEEKEMYYDAQDTYDYMTGNPIIFAESFSCLLTNDEEWEVEQCTGLKDKNGNLIYEGDIVRCSDGNIYNICWSDSAAIMIAVNTTTKIGYAIYKLKCYYDEFEIIGNIHEQPEQKDVK